jgi:hypothetical protein
VSCRKFLTSGYNSDKALPLSKDHESLHIPQALKFEEVRPELEKNNAANSHPRDSRDSSEALSLLSYRLLISENPNVHETWFEKLKKMKEKLSFNRL